MNVTEHRWFLSAIFLKVFDLTSTHIGIFVFGARESNPVMAYLMGVNTFFAYLVSFVFTLIPLCAILLLISLYKKVIRRLAKPPRYALVSKVVVWIPSFILLYVGTNNFIVLLRKVVVC